MGIAFAAALLPVLLVLLSINDRIVSATWIGMLAMLLCLNPNSWPVKESGVPTVRLTSVANNRG